LKLIGIVLLVAGILALVYGGFSYNREKGDAKIGPVEIQVNEKKHVNVPVWAGIGAVVVGAALMSLKPRG
jgi:uncharacterized membrane protein YidH (DUF202 family)